MWKALLLIAGLALSCSRKLEATAQAESGKPSTSTEGQLGEKAEVTPALAAKAKQILEARPEAPIGTTVAFTADGTDYIARFEEHDNAEGDPHRPPGKHKGVTVYRRAR